MVDDSLTIRAMVEQVLGKERDFDIVGMASDAEEANSLIKRHRPDVITLDIAMPGMDGLAFLSDIMAHHPCPVVMVSSLTAEGAEARGEALGRGAVACFHKSHIVSNAKEFVKTIRTAYRLKQSKPELFYHQPSNPGAPPSTHSEIYRTNR